MFKKKQREERAPRRRPDISTDRARPAFSYHAQRQRSEDGVTRGRMKLDDSVRLESGWRHKARTIVSGNITWALATAALIGLLFLNSFVSVGDPKLVVHGTPEQRVLLDKTSAYSTEAGKILSSSPLYRLKLTADTDGFNETFIKKHPEIASARLEMPLIGQQPVVHITPAVPTMEFVSSRGEVYIVDKTGRIIQAAEPGALNIPRVQDQSSLKVQKGSQALSSRDVSFITRVHSQLSSKGLEVSGYIIPPASRQLIVQIKGKPYTVKFTFEHDVLQQAGALIATQAKLDSMKVTPVEYIDVRVGDRVYYK